MSTKDTVGQAVQMIADKLNIDVTDVAIHTPGVRKVVELVVPWNDAWTSQHAYAAMNIVKAHLAQLCNAVTSSVQEGRCLVFGISIHDHSQTMPVTTLLSHMAEVAKRHGTEIYTDLRRMSLEIEVDVTDMTNMQSSSKPFTRRLDSLGVEYNVYSAKLEHSKPHGRRMVMSVKTDLAMLVNLRQN